MTMEFLPAGYTLPQKAGEGYMKFLEGDNRFRIMSSPIFGYEEWVDKKPMRYREARKTSDPAFPPKNFMAMIVWNVALEKIQILHLTQMSIQRSIVELCKTPEWGSPFHYDIKVTRRGKDKDTEYVVSPLPHRELHPYVIEQFYENPIWLPAIYDGLDPFFKGPKWTPCPFPHPKEVAHAFSV